MTELAQVAMATRSPLRANSSAPVPKQTSEDCNGARIVLGDPYPHHIEIADGKAHLQTAVSQLVRTMYSARGLLTPNESASSSAFIPRTTTLVARSGDKILGTVTVGTDANEGLLADERYRVEVDRIRKYSAGVCEFTRLAVAPLSGSPRILANMFNIAFVLARDLHGARDLVMEVNPRHMGYYKKMLGCNPLGGETFCPRVQAPAVLLHLSLDHVQNEIERHHKGGGKGSRNLYRHSFPPPEHPTLLKRLLGNSH